MAFDRSKAEAESKKRHIAKFPRSAKTQKEIDRIRKKLRPALRLKAREIARAKHGVTGKKIGKKITKSKKIGKKMKRKPVASSRSRGPINPL